MIWNNKTKVVSSPHKIQVLSIYGLKNMSLLHEHPEYQKLMTEYQNNLFEFANLFIRDMDVKDESFFKCISQSGMKIDDQTMSKHSAIVALWHFLFHPRDNTTLFVTPIRGRARLFADDFLKLLKVLNGTEMEWLIQFIIVKRNRIFIKGYPYFWQILIHEYKKPEPTRLAGMGFCEHLMIWVDHSCEFDEYGIDVIKGNLTSTANRLVMA